MKSDRLFGLISFLVALGYIASATQIESSDLMDPMGPRAFPILIGAIWALASLVPILKPDPDPEWPRARMVFKLSLSVVLLVLYALLIKPLGFILATAAAAALLSYQITPSPLKALLTGISLSVVIFLLFKFFLGLSLFALPEFMHR